MSKWRISVASVVARRLNRIPHEQRLVSSDTTDDVHHSIECSKMRNRNANGSIAVLQHTYTDTCTQIAIVGNAFSFFLKDNNEWMNGSMLHGTQKSYECRWPKNHYHRSNSNHNLFYICMHTHINKIQIEPPFLDSNFQKKEHCQMCKQTLKLFLMKYTELVFAIVLVCSSSKTPLLFWNP